MRRAFAVVTTVVLLVLAGCPPQEGPMPGDEAPALNIGEWIKKGAYDIADGQAVYVVEFWASWCHFCRDAVPHMTELQQAYADRGVVVVAVSNEAADEVRAFVEQQGDAMDYAVAADDSSQSFLAYGIASIPHTFVIDTQGIIVWRGHPEDPALQATLDDLTDP